MTLFVETEKTTPYFVPNRFFFSVFAPKRGWGGVYEQVITVIMVMTYHLMDKNIKDKVQPKKAMNNSS